MRTDWISYAAVLSLSIIWGSSFMLVEIALAGFHPIALSAGRIILSGAILLVFLFATGNRLPRTWQHWRWCATLGVVSLMLPFALIAWGQLHVTSGVAAIFIAGGPLFILALSRLFLGEHIGPRKWTGFAIGLGGLIWLIGPQNLTQIGREEQILGQLACLGAAFCYAASAIMIRKMPEMPLMTATVGAQVVAAVLMIPLGLAFWPAETPTALPLAALAVLGLVQTGFAQILRFYTVRRAGPVFVSVVGYLIPVWAGICGVLILGEALTTTMLVAFALILTGLITARNRPNHDP